jgi:hypothetical protein
VHPQSHEETDTALAVVQRLRSAERADGEGGAQASAAQARGLQRELASAAVGHLHGDQDVGVGAHGVVELAIKTKLEVTVVVRMPDGTEVPYLLEPAALAGGRLRARDRRADIERTLPLSHIVAVDPAD